MALIHTSFAGYVLSDLAVRAPGGTDRIILRGNHVSWQIQIPVRGEDEGREEYAARCKEFRKQVPRGSDLSLRLALAHEYYLRHGFSGWGAAYLVVTEAWPEALRFAAEENAEYRNVGVRLQTVKRRIGTSRRGHRTKRKRDGFSALDRQVETVRTQVARFKSKHPEFDKLFEAEFRGFRYQFCRDAGWCAEAELEYRRGLADCENELGPYDHWTAMATLSFARVLQAQGKLDDAIPVYRLAHERWGMATPVSEDRRAVALSSITDELASCRAGRSQAA